MSLGAESTAEIQLLESLATHPVDQPKAFDMSSSDVVSRNQFRKIRLFFSFCEITFKMRLDAARKEIGKESPDFQKAKEHLEKALQIQPVGQELRDTARDALFFFCGSQGSGTDVSQIDSVPRSGTFSILVLVESQSTNLCGLPLDYVFSKFPRHAF